MDALRFQGDFLLADILRGGQAFRWRPVDDGWCGAIGARNALLRSVPGGVEARAAPVDRRGDVARYLRLDDDYDAQLARLARDPALASAIERWRGLRLLRQDPWECLAAFIVSANNNVLRIEGILERIAEAAGTRLDAPWGAAWAFPPPREVARLGATRLRVLGCGYRAPYLAAAARAVADGVDLASLRRASRDAAREALLALDGVGPKVADCVLAFALDHTDAFPVDRHVARAVAALWPEAPQRPADLAAWARGRWERDAALAQQFVFHAERMRGRAEARA